MTTELRPLQAAEWDAWFDTVDVAFGGVPESPEQRAWWRAVTEPARMIVDTVRLAAPELPGVDGVRLRLADPAAALAECEPVYAQLVPTRPGMLARRPGWDRKAVLDPESLRNGAGPLQCVLAEVDGEV